MNLVKLTCALLACAAVPGVAATPPRQSDASFKAAIENLSTAPSYVLITEIDGNTGASRQTCVTANFLLGAIHVENELGYDSEGQMTALHIALTSRDHVFTFKRRKALDNLPHYYTDADLAKVRETTRGMSVDQVLAAMANGGPLDRLSAGGWERHVAIRDATACVLLERGASPGMGDISDRLWVAH